MRTLALVKVLSKEDANLFTRLCNSVWVIDSSPRPLLYDNEEISFDALNHLNSLNLIQHFGVAEFSLIYKSLQKPIRLGLSYYGHQHLLTLPENATTFATGKAMFTSLGAELAQVAGGTPNEEHRSRTVNHWRQQGIEVLELPMTFAATP